MPADYGTPTGDDERRAEIEAVARAISSLRAGGGEATVQKYAAQAIAALDRVRDARDDDDDPAMPYPHGMPWFEDAKTEATRPDPWQASGDPSGETHLAAPSPQGHTRACAAGEIDSECPCEARSPLSAEDDERHARWEFEQSRSPQGEDHEAGIEAAAHVNHAMYPQQDYGEARMEAEQIIAAYLSRVSVPSPERDT